jgi:integrase
MTTRRRSPGEGGCYPYKTKVGERFRVKGLVRQPDGTVKEVNKRGFLTKTEGRRWLADAQAAGRKGEYLEPSRQTLGGYGAEVIAGLRLKPQTRASYVKNWRNHIEPYPVAAVPLAQLTGAKLTAHYRQLEKSGRKDYRAGEGLSARTVRYIHTIVHGVLAQAVNDDLLARNPADRAIPPTAREAKPPEMHPWAPAQLAAFLGWAAQHSQHYALWRFLAYTGERRGEALSERWRDLSLDDGTVSIRRSAGMVRYAGEGAEMVEDDTKSSKPRVVDIDPGTVAVLRAHKAERGSLALRLVKPDALVFRRSGRRAPQRRACLAGVHPRRRPVPQGAGRGRDPGDPAARSPPHPCHGPAAGKGAHPRRIPAARPFQPGDHDDDLRPCPAGQPAGGGGDVRQPGRGGSVMPVRREAQLIRRYEPTWNLHIPPEVSISVSRAREGGG